MTKYFMLTFRKTRNQVSWETNFKLFNCNSIGTDHNGLGKNFNSQTVK